MKIDVCDARSQNLGKRDFDTNIYPWINSCLNFSIKYWLSDEIKCELLNKIDHSSKVIGGNYAI